MSAILAGGARADEVETNDGRKIEGKVVSEEGAIVKIRTRYGVIEIPRAEVKRITRGPTIEEELEAKRKIAKTGEEIYQLSRWCVEKGLAKDAKDLLAKAVEADPNHEGAHRALGHVKDGADWVTLDEKRKRDAARERALLESKGLVEYQGRWVTPEERDALEKGLEKVGNRWLKPDEANRAKGLELFDGKWIPAMDALAKANLANAEKAIGGKGWTLNWGKHAATGGTFDAPYVEAVAATAEKAYQVVDRLFGGDGTGSVVSKGTAKVEGWKPNIPAPLVAAAERMAPLCELLVFEGDPEYERAVDACYAESKSELAEGWPAAAKRSHGFFVVHPIGRSVVVARGRDREAVAGHTCHHLGHLLAHRHLDTPMFLPPWYDEAIALLAEDGATGAITMFCSVKPVSGTRVDDPKSNKSAIKDWRARLRDANKAGRCQSLAAIVTHDLFDLTTDDLLKAASVVEFLSSKEGALERFHAFLQTNYGYARLPDTARELHDKAFRAAIKADLKNTETQWEMWLSSKGSK